jgi:hypothetical protein
LRNGRVVDDPGKMPDDIVITIRPTKDAVLVFLKAPEHEDDSVVPEDFLVALGVTRAFSDPAFRRAMLRLARNVIENGDVEGIDPVFERADLN